MTTVYLSGAGMTRFGRHPDQGLFDLAVEAAEAAIADSGLSAADIDTLYFGNFLGRGFERQGVMASLLARRLKLGNVPTTNVEGACGSAGIALRHGVLSVAAGAAGAELVVGAEHMTAQDTPTVTQGLAEAGEAVTDGAAGITFPGFFGLVANAHAAQYGTTREHFSAVSVKNRRHAVSNPLAMFQKEVTLEQASTAKPIADPLRLLDCSPICDGAAAAVVTTEALAQQSRGGAVKVLACEQSSGPVAVWQMDTLTSFPATLAAAERAYKNADIRPSDLDVVELHDCFSITEIVNTADLGLIPHGEAHLAIAEGVTGSWTPGLVVNPGGGLLGRGHPVGATGLSQVYEIVSQLRGTSGNQVEGARLGLAHNLGGAGATSTVTIFERV
ncbi:thiolase C-terminal domain-containing protein [Rhodococcus gordoniae]